MANTLISVPAIPLTAAFITIYTVPQDTQFTVSVIHLTNCTGASVLLRACLVPAGGTAATSNALSWDFGITENGILELARGQVWNSGDSFQALGDGLTLHLSGIETR